MDSISLPGSFLPENPHQFGIGLGPALRDEALAPFPRTPFAVKTHIREYYAIITHLDQQIGLILDELEASGQLENTYLFFTADHGLAVGRHGLLGKQNQYDHSIRVPLIITGPDIPKGKRVSADVYLQDIMATTLDLAGIPKPAYVEFHSLLELARGEASQSPYPAIYGAYVDFQRMIRKDGYKLIVYPKIEKVLLFDLERDPEELQDLASQAAYREKVRELFSELIGLQKSMDDPLDLHQLFQKLAMEK
jgi:arylsulfatase A-like enzyme